MNLRKNLLLILLGALALPTACAGSQAQLAVGEDPATEELRQTTDEPPRGIRRTMPMTSAIRRAFAAGTRDETGRPGPNYWQLETDFSIQARLDPATQTITGKESIEVHNNSPAELTQLVLRLDHNVFRARVPRGSSVPAETTDGMVVTRIAVNGEEVDLTARARSGQLGVRGLNQTVAVVSLAEPIAPESGATLEIDWTTKLPGGDGGQAHRMTQRWGETLFQPTQWFPRLAKYDDLRGWDMNVYLGPAEFYNNFGRFDVSIDVPAGWIVSGTGVLQNPEEVLTAAARERLAQVLESDDEIMIVTAEEMEAGAATKDGERLVWRFAAEYVNDFVWATAENFVWRATRATIPGKGPVPIHMVYLPERAGRFERAGTISRHALEFYSDLWAPYPFPQLTLQDGPSAGMEYPMVINSNQGAADHEVAHQWWPMMVGTNETWYGWMDEGLNTYMNILSGADSRGVPPNLDGRGQSYGNLSGNESEPTMMWISNYGGPMYGFQTYMKAPMMLSMLGGIVGDDAVQAAISEYTEAWSFKHPSPWDFAFFLSNELEEDLGWFWYYWLFTTESVDGSIEDVTTSGSRTVVTVRQDGEMPAPVVLAVQFASADTVPVEATHGEATPGAMPDAEFLEDGTAIVTWPVDVWFDGRRTFEAELDFGGRSIETITLDPGGRFPDRDPSDNVWPRAN
jgi:hypothetical protein